MGLTGSQRSFWKEEQITSAPESMLRDKSLLDQDEACRVWDGKSQRTRLRMEKALSIVKRLRHSWEEQERNTHWGPSCWATHQRNTRVLLQHKRHETSQVGPDTGDRTEGKLFINLFGFLTYSFILKLTIDFFLLIKPFLKVIFRIIQFRCKGYSHFLRILTVRENKPTSDQWLYVDSQPVEEKEKNKNKNKTQNKPKPKYILKNMSIRFRCSNLMLDLDALIWTL